MRDDPGVAFSSQSARVILFVVLPCQLCVRHGSLRHSFSQSLHGPNLNSSENCDSDSKTSERMLRLEHGMPLSAKSEISLLGSGVIDKNSLRIKKMQNGCADSKGSIQSIFASGAISMEGIQSLLASEVLDVTADGEFMRKLTQSPHTPRHNLANGGKEMHHVDISSLPSATQHQQGTAKTSNCSSENALSLLTDNMCIPDNISIESSFSAMTLMEVDESSDKSTPTNVGAASKSTFNRGIRRINGNRSLTGGARKNDRRRSSQTIESTQTMPSAHFSNVSGMSLLSTVMHENNYDLLVALTATEGQSHDFDETSPASVASGMSLGTRY